MQDRQTWRVGGVADGGKLRAGQTGRTHHFVNKVALAQLVEHRANPSEVIGSSPIRCPKTSKSARP